MRGVTLSWPLSLLALVQALLAGRVLLRLARTAGGSRIAEADGPSPSDEQVTVVLPVLDERERIEPCLDGLMGQGCEVAEILVVDGGSTDGTQAIVARYAARDPRVRLVDASPIPAGWNGKAWGLHVGHQQSTSESDWILTIDADVRPAPALTRSLLAHARDEGVAALSVATEQQIVGLGEGLIHPALLTTLVYRFGIPGQRIARMEEVQANGQCFLVRRFALEAVGGFAAVADSICEDITLARRLVRQGLPLGFYESEGLVAVRMYPDWRATWHEWPRSLPMRDRYSGLAGWVGLLEVLLVQALPLPLLIVLQGRGERRGPARVMLLINTILAATRLGVLFGTARAYPARPRSYWLSPLADLPVAIQLIRHAVRRRYTWRGRPLVRGGI